VRAVTAIISINILAQKLLDSIAFGFSDNMWKKFEILFKIKMKA
jgi:hypothetical protein